MFDDGDDDDTIKKKWEKINQLLTTSMLLVYQHLDRELEIKEKRLGLSKYYSEEEYKQIMEEKKKKKRMLKSV